VHGAGDPSGEGEQPQFSRPEVDEEITKLLRSVHTLSFLSFSLFGYFFIVCFIIGGFCMHGGYYIVVMT
jgi:hypothetical protein